MSTVNFICPKCDHEYSKEVRGLNLSEFNPKAKCPNCHDGYSNPEITKMIEMKRKRGIKRNRRKEDFLCTKCGCEWSQFPDEDGLFNGRGIDTCPLCGTNGNNPYDFGDWVCCTYGHEFRIYGNGGLICGCIPSCPECGNPVRESKINYIV